MVLCVSRMVPRKGQDTLIKVWPTVLAGQHAARPVLLLVGDGPYARDLHALVRREQVTDSVIFAGPGLDVEGLGIVYLEASAAGLPVISGDSGGAPDAVLPGETGYVVGGRDEAALADRLSQLLADPQGAATMGEKGLAWVDREWRWDIVAGRLAEILANVG